MSFQHEAQLLVSLNAPGHPGIPDIYEYLTEHHCLVMKYIEGRSLDHILDRRVTPLPEQEALRYMRDVCSALVYMHSRIPEPVLHRDIKPGNILVDAAERVWLIDFGLSKSVPAAFSLSGSRHSRGAGTLGFTPPEQWHGAAQPRSDVYALGATLHVLLTFYQPDQDELLALMRGRSQGLPPASQLNPAVSRTVEGIIQRATSFDITARPSAGDLLAELDALLNDSIVAPPPPPARVPMAADFVGRGAELDILRASLAANHRVVVTGLSGVGKTALAAVLAEAVHEPDQIFWHTFHQNQGMEAVIWELAAFLARHGQDELWRLVQGIRKSQGQAPPVEVLIDYIIATARDRHYLLCFDDIQFIDDDPLFGAFIQRVHDGEHGFDLILISRRIPSFVSRSEALHLEGLTSADARRFLQGRELSLPDDVFDVLYAATEGNVQLLVLAAQAIQQGGDVTQIRDRLVAADDIERYLLTKVDAGLTEEMRDVLSGIAVLQEAGGTRAAIEALVDRSRLQRILHELARSHLLTAIDDQPGQAYQLHAVVQAFYYAQLSKRERVALHRRAGVFYESDEIDLLKAARHFLLAGEHGRAARLAASDIWAVVNRGQVRGLRWILEQFTPQQLDVFQWLDITIARADVYMLLRESEQARATYTAALDHLAALPPSLLVRTRKAHICRGMGELLEYESPQEALDWLSRGLDELVEEKALASSQEQRLEEALLRLRVGSVLIAMGKYPAARDALDQSARLLPEGASQWRASVFLKLGVVHCSQGDTEQGKICYVQALEIYQQLGNYWGMIGVWHNLGIELVFAGDWAGAEIQYRNALNMAERLGNVARRVTVELSLGYLSINQGDMARARAHLMTCLDLARAHNLKEYHVSSQSSLADLHLRLGEWAAAQPLLSEAEQLALEMDAQWQLPEIYRGWVELHLAHGQLQAALDAADRAVRLARDLDDPREEGLGLRVLAQAQHAAGYVDQALDTFERSLSFLEGRDPYEAARTRLHLGVALCAAGDTGRGPALVEAARDTFQALGAQHDLAVAASVDISPHARERSSREA